MNIAILTSPNQWYEAYANKLSIRLGNVPVYKDHACIEESLDILFILSYHRIIDKKFLKKNKHNVVIHESDLPSGKGWAPLFWQILEGKSEITFSMFEASDGVDNGDVYLRDKLFLDGYELNNELRHKQACLIEKMCLSFFHDYNHYTSPSKQLGIESFYSKRTPKDSELNIDKTIREQFNLLRIVDNENYPAYFMIDDNKYLLKIEKAD
jgi:methionyl-tRNA formyltransferase